LQILAKFLCSVPLIVAIAFASNMQSQFYGNEEVAYIHYIVSSLERAVYESAGNHTSIALKLSYNLKDAAAIACSGYVLSSYLNNRIIESVSLPYACYNFDYVLQVNQTITVSYVNDKIFFSV